MDLLLATTPNDYVTTWWPLWAAWLLASLSLIFVGRPSRLRRIAGVALLGVGLFVYGWAVFFNNGCIEGYADWTSCDVSSASVLLGVALLAGSVLTALWSIRR